MKHIISISLLLALMACTQQKEPDFLSTKNEDKEASLQTLKDAKFGLFIHWGLYSIPAGEWNGEKIPGIGEWIMKHGKIPAKDYEQLASQFNPSAYNADDYVALAKNTGMKYLVLTSKHHDGFAMFQSDADAYNVVDGTPYGKDIVKELAIACHEQEMPFGLYYSQAQDWDHPNGARNTWDYPKKTKAEDYEPYVANKALPQVKEITSKYGPLFLVWFDTPVGLSKDQALRLAQEVNKNQPGTLVTDRIGFDMGTYAQMPDNGIPIQVKADRYWETPATLNETWGYKSYDHKWKQPKELIYKLADIVSKGGNYLLNIGPDATGAVPQASLDILSEIGTWIKANGESIYETTHSPFYYDQIDWRCTQKKNTLYLHVLSPISTIDIKGLMSKVVSAELLANGKALDFEQTEGQLSIDFPQEGRDKYNTVIKVTIADEMAQVAPEHRFDYMPETIKLFPQEARLRGDHIHYDADSRTASNFVPKGRPENMMIWYLQNVALGKYTAEIEYECGNDVAGGKYKLYTDSNNKDDKNKKGKITGELVGTNGEFITQEACELEISESTESIIFTLAAGKSKSCKVKSVTLTKK